MRIAWPALAAMALAGAAALHAQPSPNGGELQVNSYTTNAQRSPAVGVDGTGAFVVVWESAGSSGGDTGGYSVQAQRYDANGAPLGAQFQVNTYTTSNQYDPAVAMAPGGAFVVVWSSDGSAGTDTSGYSIQARRYDAAGVPQGAEFQVNTYTTLGQSGPAVAMGDLGQFVVVWESLGSDGTDTSSWSIQGQRYNGAGVPLVGQFQVDTYTTSEQEGPAVAMNAGGSFVVAWHSNGSDADSSLYSVRGRRYDATGAPLANDFQVNVATTGEQRDPRVALDAAGNAVVVWRSNAAGDADVRAQRYSSAGVGSGEFQVNTLATSYQGRPSAASDAAGNFVVAWRSDGSAGSDTLDASIQARRYRADGTAIEAEFQVNTYTAGSQLSAALAVNARGDFIVGWQSPGSSGTDSSNASIQAQRFDALFRDGFESVTTARWSSTVQ
jgi:hypothetical protein